MVPSHNRDYYRKQAKLLVRQYKEQDRSILGRLALLHRFSGLSPPKVFEQSFRLYEAQYIVALEHGFRSWRELKGTCVEQEEKRMEKQLHGIAMEENNTFAGAVSAVLKHWGQEVDYGMVVGLLGGIGSPAWNKSEACAAWWMEGGDDTRLGFAGQVLGFSVRRLSHKEDSAEVWSSYEKSKQLPEGMERYWHEIQREFTGGNMVLLKTWPTWSVLTGWSDDFARLEFVTHPGYKELCEAVWGPRMTQRAYILARTKRSMTYDQAVREAVSYASQLANGEVAHDDVEFGGVLYRKALERMDAEYFCSECGPDGGRCAYRTIVRMRDMAADTSAFFRISRPYFSEDNDKELIDRVIDLSEAMAETESFYSGHDRFVQQIDNSGFREKLSTDLEHLVRDHGSLSRTLRELETAL
jgi:hypothetical protein